MFHFSLSLLMKDNIYITKNLLTVVQFSMLYSVEQNKMWFWPLQALVTPYLLYFPKIHIALDNSFMCYINPGSHKRTPNFIFVLGCVVNVITCISNWQLQHVQGYLSHRAMSDHTRIIIFFKITQKCSPSGSESITHCMINI